MYKRQKGKIAIGGFGPMTLKAIEDAGLTADIAAPTPQHRSMPDALAAFLEKNT